MNTAARLNLGNARVVTTRELSRDTATVVDSVVSQGQPAVITKHGRLIAVLVGVAHIKEASLLTTHPAESFIDSLGSHDVDGVAQGLTVGDALELVGLRGRPDRQSTRIPEATVVTMRRLNQETTAVLNGVRDSGTAAVVTRYGRWAVAVLPIPPDVESDLLTSVAARAFTDALGGGLRDGAAYGLTPEQAIAHVNLSRAD